MFGIGFTEILLISIIAILFLGPDKLPETMVQIAKFIKGVKKTVGDAKGALEEEMKIADLKDEALNYKKQLDSATSELRSFKNIDLDDILEDEPTEKKLAKPETQESVSETKVEQKSDVVTFKKKSRKKKEKTSEESTEKIAENTSDKKTEKKEGNA
jgi:sec-independent protein translocase protein TatB